MKTHQLKLNKFQLYHGHFTMTPLVDHVISLKNRLKHIQKYFEDSMAASTFAEKGEFDYARQIVNHEEEKHFKS